MDLSFGLLSGALVFAFSCLYIWARKRRRLLVPLPPGPRPLPVIGNVRDLTLKELWLKVTEWASIHGERYSPFECQQVSAHFVRRGCLSYTHLQPEHDLPQ